MYSVALILPYFGKLPNYFPLWLKSAGTNKDFDFMIFSDIDFTSYKIPDNVHVHYMTLEEIRTRAAKYLGFECVLDRPYKLCDYKPLNGLIFQDYLEGFDFWGNVDPDVIWGDMSKFITPYVLKNYDKLFRLGHLVIYRNTEKINRFVLNELPGWNISYRDIYRTSCNMSLAESPLNVKLFSKFACNGGGVYDRIDFADIHPCYKEFRKFNYIYEVIPAFRWSDGKIFGLAVNGQIDEYLYLHIQKRVMHYPEGLDDDPSFMVVPNEFMKDHELTEQEIQIFTTPDSEYEARMREKYYNLWGIRRKPILERIKIFLRRDKYDKIIRLKMRLNRFLKRDLSSL